MLAADSKSRQAILERRATPSFDGTPIPPEDLRIILEAGLTAPSGYNIQPWRFIVVQGEEQKKRLRAASFNQAKVEEASAVIVACVVLSSLLPDRLLVRSSLLILFLAQKVYRSFMS